MSVLDDLPSFLGDAIGRFGVPGASVSVLVDGSVHEAAAGVVNTETKVETTTDTVFQIGSITKLLTTAMAMQLADEGKLDIDAPVRTALPDFAVGDAGVSAGVTPRHLLNHSSGIDGDFFVDAGRGDDVLTRLLEMGRSLPQLHGLGEGFSYCNFGFAVMGRLIETLDGVDWDSALHRRVARRLDTEFLITRPEQLLRRRTAIGHVPGKQSGSLVPARHPYLPFAMGPAGATPTCRARDLITLASAFLADGDPLVSPSAVMAMRMPNTGTVNSGAITDFGLGFMLFDWKGVPLFGHDGATVGQNSFLRIHDSGIAVALLTNGGDVQGLAHEVMTTVFTELGGFAPPRPPEGTARSVDPSRYIGTYSRGLTSFEVTSEAGVLNLRTGPGDDWSEGLVPPTGPFLLQPVDDETFTYRLPGAALPLSVRFMDPDGSRHFTALHAGMRRNPLRSQP